MIETRNNNPENPDIIFYGDPMKSRMCQRVKSASISQAIKECICCQNCKQIFNLASNSIKIHCAGCQKFFHCGIAGKCVGPNCTGTTINGEKHSLSWCVKCVPLIEGNGVKKDGIGTCICKECLETITK